MTHLDHWQQRMVRDAATHAARATADRCCDFPHEYPPMNRQIHDHKVNGLNEAIEVIALDMPGPGGANHAYVAHLFAGKAPFHGQSDNSPVPSDVHVEINFQNGPVSEVGFNGISNEALLAIVIDRLRGFQYGRKENAGGLLGPAEFDESKRGTYACRENAVALTHLEEGLMWLQKRTRDRMARGVEGTHRV